MKIVIHTLILALVCAAVVIPAYARQVYFPSKAFGENPASSEYWRSRYSKQLRSLKEPSLYEERKSASSQSYRFLWLRTFMNPFRSALTSD